MTAAAPPLKRQIEETQARPFALAPDFVNIPEALRLRPQWVTWRFVLRDRKWTKIPFDPFGRHASTTDPTTWGTFDEVRASYLRGGSDGIGFVFSGEDGFTGVDLDSCVNPDTGEWTAEAAEILARFDTYSELSPTGTGIKLFLRGDVRSILGDGRSGSKHGNYEAYTAGRYFTLTGKLAGFIPTLEERQDTLAWFVAQFINPKPLKPIPDTNGSYHPPSPHLDDAKIWDAIKRSEKWPVIESLMNGDTKAYGGDDSCADLALCNHLAFWFGPDPSRVEANFNLSKLAERGKWRNRPDYRQRTIAKAVAACTRHYGDNWQHGSADKPGTREPKSVNKTELPLDDTDVANGLAFVSDHGQDVRYLGDCGLWAVYTGKRWEIDRSETQVERRAKATVIRMARKAADRLAEVAKQYAAADGEQSRLKAEMDKAKADLNWGKKSQDMRSIRRTLQAARSETAVYVSRVADVFDIRRDLLNCPNGTIELRAGILREHRREDYLTRLCPIEYDPDASRDAYLAFLSTTFDGRPSVAEYVRDLAGYVLTGEVSDQTLNIFNGDGSNGKSLLVESWGHVLGEGEYAHTAAAELLVSAGRDRHPTELTGLRGARLVICAESGEGGELDESKMKKLTGGDTVAARYMRQDFFTFKPSHKLILLTNNRPRVRGTDHGVWRRIRLVPFAVRFWKDADRELDPSGSYLERFRADPKLGERLRTSAAQGILADMVERAIKFYREGGTLNPPADVTRATSEYRQDQDIIGQFFVTCVREDEGARVKASELYAVFKRWWEAEGYDPKKAPGPRKFGIEAGRKFVRTKASSSTYAVRIIPEGDRDEGRMGVSSDISPRACAHIKSSYLEDVPFSLSPCDDPGEREAISTFGGG